MANFINTKKSGETLKLNNYSTWILAARPKTLWAAFAPVLIGLAMAYADHCFDPGLAVLTLLCALSIQIGTNFCNDYADFKKGADTAERQGPLRVTQAGLVSPRAMLRATCFVFVLAAALFVYLTCLRGWPLAVIGAAAVLSGILYTAGPYPLGYHGWGDLFVLIFLGPVAVGGTYYIQTSTISMPVVWAGFSPGLLSVAILVMNNLRDVETDAKSGKRTLAVRWGERFSRLEYLICIGAAVALPVLLVAGSGRRPYTWGVLLVYAAAWPAVKQVMQGARGQKLNPLLGYTAKLLLLYSVLFSIGWIL